MTMIFLGGSRNLSRLNSAIKERADKIFDKNFEILIGDANGADKAMQKYLAEKGYKKVIVYCMEDSCRNNIGNWQTRIVRATDKIKDFSYYEKKDIAMSEQADYGFMLWDGKSKGTLNNMINLLQRSKYVLVYLTSSKDFITLKTPSDLENLLKKCDPSSVQRFYHTLQIKERLDIVQKKLNLA